MTPAQEKLLKAAEIVLVAGLTWPPIRLALLDAVEAVKAEEAVNQPCPLPCDEGK